MKKLLKKIEEEYKMEQQNFWSLSGEIDEGGGGGGGGVGVRDCGTEEFQFLISSTDPSCVKRNVHMPGYPE